MVAEIIHDLAHDVPIMRLGQGDVGSGKTLVVALMAHTELLAEQHAQNFRDWFAPRGIEVDWLAGKQKKKARQAAGGHFSDGRVSMVVDTYAISQKRVRFAGLAMVILD